MASSATVQRLAVICVGLARAAVPPALADPPVWGEAPPVYTLEENAVVASDAGGSTGDHYLVTAQEYSDFLFSFDLTRMEAGGTNLRAIVVWGLDVADRNNRACFFLPVADLAVGETAHFALARLGDRVMLKVNGDVVSRSPSVYGEPLTRAPVGFLHYYNYAFDYTDLAITAEGGEPRRPDLSSGLDRDFWARVEPTYSAAGGVLQARDAESLQLAVHLLAAPEREIIRAQAEGYGVRGKSPFEGHLIVRDRPADPASLTAFVAVIEASDGRARVSRVEALPIAPAADGRVVALRVETVTAGGRPRSDVVISSLEDDAAGVVTIDGTSLQFRGRFGLMTHEDGTPAAAMLVGGGHLGCAGALLEQPGDFTGSVTAAEVETAALRVRADEGSGPCGDHLVGRKLLVSNPDYPYPGVYTVQRVEPAGAEWRLYLNMPLVVARGVIAALTPAEGFFASATPVMKLRVNPGLFDGRCARVSPDGPECRLRSAAPDAFRLAKPEDIRLFRQGAEYLVCDVGAGDRVRVMSQGSRRFP